MKTDHNPDDVKLEYGQIWESNIKSSTGDSHWIVIGFGKRHVKTMTIDGQRETQAAIWHLAFHYHIVGSIV